MKGNFELEDLVAESGLRCPRCHSTDCVRKHAWRYRKRVKEFHTGDVFENLPILRIKFCTGPTRSILPADLWRGRSTVRSVLQTVIHARREGVGPALEWAAYAGSGEEPVSERSIRRWKKFVDSRLIGAAFSWLAPKLGWAWSDSQDLAGQLGRLLEGLTGPLQLAFRATAGYAVIDRPTVTQDTSRSHCAAWPVPGRHAETISHDPPSKPLPRGTWLPHNRRGPPRKDSKTGDGRKKS